MKETFKIEEQVEVPMQTLKRVRCSAISSPTAIRKYLSYDLCFLRIKIEVSTDCQALGHEDLRGSGPLHTLAALPRRGSAPTG